jgi:hypothetical protein
MALLELCNDTPVHRVAEMYGVPRGDMQSLRQTAVAFAGMVSVILRSNIVCYALYHALQTSATAKCYNMQSIWGHYHCQCFKRLIIMTTCSHSLLLTLAT